MLVDAHCHVHDPRAADAARRQHGQKSQNGDALSALVRRAAAANLTHVVSCACFAADWDALEALMRRWESVCGSTAIAGDSSSHGVGDAAPSIRLVPSFGLHPWWAGDASNDDAYVAQLRALLERHPIASLGEIGLCSSRRGQAVDAHVQERVFSEQLRLATELSRTCVIHCVGRYGKLLELLLATLREAKQLPPRIVLHSYAGGAEQAASFLALEKKAPGTRVFFSLNAKQLTDTRSDKAVASCAAIPLSALLLETDAPDQIPDAGAIERFWDSIDALGVSREEMLEASSSELNEPALVAMAYARAAEIRQMEPADLAAAVYNNAVEAFNLGRC